MLQVVMKDVLEMDSNSKIYFSFLLLLCITLLLHDVLCAAADSRELNLWYVAEVTVLLVELVVNGVGASRNHQTMTLFVKANIHEY